MEETTRALMALMRCLLEEAIGTGALKQTVPLPEGARVVPRDRGYSVLCPETEIAWVKYDPSDGLMVEWHTTINVKGEVRARPHLANAVSYSGEVMSLLPGRKIIGELDVLPMLPRFAHRALDAVCDCQRASCVVLLGTAEEAKEFRKRLAAEL